MKGIGLLVAAAVVLLNDVSASAAAKKKPVSVPSDGKLVLDLTPLEDMRVQMPDESVRSFGRGFELKLVRYLMDSGRYLITEPESPVGVSSLSDSTRDDDLPPIIWTGDTIPAAKIKIHVDALTFSTGGRGERTAYGFDERFRSEETTEFPVDGKDRFEGRFTESGFAPFSSRSGLDLGEGLSINAFFAWLSLKYASYESQLRLTLDIDAPMAGRHELRQVQVIGKGFFFDLVGGYMGYSAGLKIGRTDAMNRAIDQAFDGTFSAVERAVVGLPLTARIDGVLQSDGTLLLATGTGAAVRPGVWYELVDAPGVVIEVTQSMSSGSLGHVVRGDATLATTGRLLRQTHDLPPDVGASIVRASAAVQVGGELAASESISLPFRTLDTPDYGDVQVDSNYLEAFFRSLLESIFLPYRIWRYFQYDLTYRAESDSSSDRHTHKLFNEVEGWADTSRKEPWARQIGLDAIPVTGAPASPGNSNGTVVAVLDTGVDYNHSAIHHALWLNPLPWLDPAGRQDRYGWDFISGDSRPFDDEYHGTRVASLVLAVDPSARIMPLKVFNPWGITHSRAIAGAFKYAVDHGAKIIVCAWATPVASQAIREGIAYAKNHDVTVIASAGSLGKSLEEHPNYPASFAKEFDNLLAVGGVDETDQITSSYSEEIVRIAAPSNKILVAEPRNGKYTPSSPDLAAAIVAGAVSRLPGPSSSQRIEQVLEQSDSIPRLRGWVQGARRLHIR